MNRILGPTILLASVLALGGCGTSLPKGFVCPGAAALVDAGSLTVLSVGTTDPSRAVYKVDITKVATACDFDPDKNQIVARIGVNFSGTRAPGGNSAQIGFVYFVGVSQEGTSIVDKKLYDVRFAFTPGQTSKSFSDRIESFVIPLPAGKKSTDYELLIGLQLTKEQLDYNRRVGRFPQ